MTFTTATKLKLTALAATAIVGASTAVPADAIVPPKNCGAITYKSKKYTVKTDQLSCTTAKRFTLDFLRNNDRPRYYTCRRYSGSRLIFRCAATRYSPDRTFFAIKR